MNAYEYKQEARRLRLEAAAARAQQQGEASLSSARQLVEGIPFGQPILVGHHSEKRHRRTLEKHDNRMRAGFARLKDAEELARRAEAVGSGGISGDDPEAVEKLGDKVADLEARRDRMKLINSAFRKGRGGMHWADLVEPTLTEREVKEINSTARAQPFYKGIPYPPYCLTNIGARIREAKRRATEIAERSKAEAVEEEVNGCTIRTDPDDNRIVIEYPRRLSKDEYQNVRRAGFVWSPTRGGFTRKLGGGGVLYWARELVKGFTP